MLREFGGDGRGGPRSTTDADGPVVLAEPLGVELADDAHHVHGERLFGRGPERVAIANIEAGAVQWTDHPRATQSPFAQARVCVRAHVVDRKEPMRGVADEDVAPAQHPGVHPAGTQISKRHDRFEALFAHP